MPAENCFHHQTYLVSSPSEPDYEVVNAGAPVPLTGEAFGSRMERVGQLMRKADVGTVLLVHGTFAGTDVLGIVRSIEPLASSLGRALRRHQKQFIDAWTGSMGNYPAQFATTFQQAICAALPWPITVECFHWSGENVHVGRAEAAIQLIDHLLDRAQASPGRILLWGHSHAGNVFALVTNLLAAPAAARAEFFEAARTLYRWPVIGKVDRPLWLSVAERMEQDETRRQLADRLDIATFGTPIRYGWDSGGYCNLLHFVYHRPVADLPVHHAPLPRTLQQVLQAEHGDYIQLLGIAGTDLVPYIFSPRMWLAERRLSRLLQRGVRRRDFLRHLRQAPRLAHEGKTLLVDYPIAHEPFPRHLAGHGVYTRPEWLVFHAEQVAQHFYAS